jgi:hypothetical protein
MKAILVVFLVAAVAVAGCETKIDPKPTGSEFTPEPYPELVNGCLFTVCNANESSHDYGLVYDKLGLRQINFDRHREMGVGVAGDLVVWQIDRRVNGTTNWDTFAYNITQDKLYAVGWESYYTQTVFVISQGRVVINDGSSTELPDNQVPLPRRAFLRLWEETTGERRILETGLQGGPSVTGFSNPWITFENSNNDNPKTGDGGLYAMNVDTGEVVPLYQDRYHPEFNVKERPAGPTVVDGVAYYEVHGVETNNRTFQLHEVNLTTKEDRVVHVGTGYRAVGRMEADGRHVVWLAATGSLGVLYHYDRVTGEGGPLTDPAVEDPVPDHSLGGDWVVYEANHAGGRNWGILATHILTKTRHVLIPDDEKLFPGIVGTDGKRFVASLWRNDQNLYDENGQDLYWGNLPEVPDSGS